MNVCVWCQQIGYWGPKLPVEPCVDCLDEGGEPDVAPVEEAA